MRTHVISYTSAIVVAVNAAVIVRSLPSIPNWMSFPSGQSFPAASIYTLQNSRKSCSGSMPVSGLPNPGLHEGADDGCLIGMIGTRREALTIARRCHLPQG
jgi:hypothetical protein